jgi:hypothetical protein
MKDWLSRLENEYNQLAEKSIILHDFILSDDFKSVSKNEKDLLRIQLGIMASYLSCLESRLSYHGISVTRHFQTLCTIPFIKE